MNFVSSGMENLQRPMSKNTVSTQTLWVGKRRLRARATGHCRQEFRLPYLMSLEVILIVLVMAKSEFDSGRQHRMSSVEPLNEFLQTFRRTEPVSADSICAVFNSDALAGEKPFEC